MFPVLPLQGQSEYMEKLGCKRMARSDIMVVVSLSVRESGVLRTSDGVGGERAMSDSTLPNVIFGVVAICAGLLIVRFRTKLNERIYESQRKMFGRRVARVSAGRQTPFMMGIVGILAIVIGIVVVSAAIAKIFLAGGV